MQTRRLFRAVFCAAVVAVAAGPPVHAEESTPRQREACKPDVYRLCKWYILSHSGITYCLHANINRLSSECRAVMEGGLR
ncbi:MAG: hypothetical protein ACREQD_01375 [Candidatus Binataceae bacterium]